MISDKEGRYVWVKGRVEGVLISLLNIYAPPGSDWSFYRQMFDLMASEGDGVLIAGGDLNQKLYPLLDTTGREVKKNGIPNKIEI